MPNGGSKNCTRCLHNKAVQEFGDMPHSDSDQRETFFDLSYCEFHDVNLTNPAWTYCRRNTALTKNSKKDKEWKTLANQSVLPEGVSGAIWGTGLQEKFGQYIKIPWHSKEEPKINVSCVCTVCETKTDDDGIIVIHDGKEVGFCSNRHYIDWWKTKHDDPDILSDIYGHPYRTKTSMATVIKECWDYIKKRIRGI